VKQIHFPEQSINWDYLLDKFAQASPVSISGALFQEGMQFLLMCGLSSRVKALPFRVWRDCITSMIQNSNFSYKEDNTVILREIREKLTYFENEFPKLKEATTMLELAVWKMKMNEKSHQDMATQSQKKVKTDESSIRQQCRITCGADVIIEYVLPFLITA
jgi:hypothetical protein